MDWLTYFQQLFNLLRSKKFAATICTSWVLLHIAMAYPSQFVQLTAFCHKYMHIMDLLAILSAAYLILSALQAALLFFEIKPRLRKIYLKHAAIKEIQRILKTPASNDYELLIRLYQKPESPCNPFDPLVRRLVDYCIITAIGDALLTDDLKTYSGPYTLTHTVRQYMKTHCGEQLHK